MIRLDLLPTILTRPTYSKMTGLAAVVATAVGTVQAQGRAVSLDVAEALAVVALLCWKTISTSSQGWQRRVPYSRLYEDEGRR